MRYELNTKTNVLYRINNERLEIIMEKSSLPVFEDSYGNGVCLYDNESMLTYAQFAEKAGVDYSDFAEIVFKDDEDYEDGYQKAHCFY